MLQFLVGLAVGLLLGAVGLVVQGQRLYRWSGGREGIDAEGWLRGWGQNG